jgi:multidrug efflux pump subunit AcrA (membrane-fusion protein)
VQLLDADGKVAAVNPISFVAPRVDVSTQSVLVKSLLKDAPPKLRSQQFTRARIVWSTADGLTVPVVAVSRVSGQYFCFVAETQGNGLVARQRPVQVGEVIGDDYVVASGLKAGDRIVTSGIQKLANGAPIKVQ